MFLFDIAIVAVVLGSIFVFAVDMFSHLFACIQAKKDVYTHIRNVAYNGTVRELRQLCKQYPSKFSGYSAAAKQGKACLQEFVLARVYS